MCGIFAYLQYNTHKTRREILQTLMGALQQMEYRGCDSAGLAVDDDSHTDGVPLLIRKAGAVRDLEIAVEEHSQTMNFERVFQTHVALAHTRWATHGGATDVNAHPQPSDPTNEFVVVHNGMITNCATLRKMLDSHGYKAQSETDTEVVPQLCSYLYQLYNGHVSFSELVSQVLSQCDGTFGMVFKSRHFPHEAVAAKRGSPLIIASSNEDRRSLQDIYEPQVREFFIASDPTALLKYSRNVVYLEDGDIVHFKDGVMSMYAVEDPCSFSPPFTPPTPAPDASFGQLSPGMLCPISPAVRMPSVGACKPLLNSRKPTAVEAELEMVMKGSFPHFMLKEIYEQPEALRNTLRGRISARYPDMVKLGGIVPYVDTIRQCRRVLLFAVATAYYGCMAVRTPLEELLNVPVIVELATESEERCPPIFRDDVCCFVSHTGENANVLAMLRYCKSKGALCIGFTNVVGSSVARETECGVYLHAGFELGVTKTKVYGSQIVALLMFALVIADDSVAVQSRRRGILNAMRKLPKLIRDFLQSGVDATMKEAAQEFKECQNFLVMGRGYQLATCLEAAHKLKETAMVHSEGIHLGELKHGPLALVDEHMPVIVFCTREHRYQGDSDDDMYPKVMSSLQQVLAREGRPIVISNDAIDPDIEKQVHKTIIVPRTLDCLQTILNVIPIQLLSYHLGNLRGTQLDKPKATM